MTNIIAVAGGKGGVGKTLIATNIAVLLSERGKTLLVDADVDNPCVLPSIRGLDPKIEKIEEVTRFRPLILQEKCDLCGKCVEACPEHALVLIPGQRLIHIDSLCAGCSVCKLVCEKEAIKEDTVIEGYIKYGKTTKDYNIDLIIGELKPGERRSYVIMSKLLEGHRELFSKYDNVIIDSPPGTGAGVFSVLRNSEKYIIVTEPTRLGIADLKKILQLIEEKFGNRKVVIVVNKANLSPEGVEEIRKLCSRYTVFEIPYSREIAEYYARGETVVDKVRDVRKIFEKIVEELLG